MKKRESTLLKKQNKQTKTKNRTNEQTNINRVIDTEDKQAFARREEGEGWKEVREIKTYKLLVSK